MSVPPTPDRILLHLVILGLVQALRYTSKEQISTNPFIYISMSLEPQSSVQKIKSLGYKHTDGLATIRRIEVIPQVPIKFEFGCGRRGVRFGSSWIINWRARNVAEILRLGRRVERRLRLRGMA